MQKIKKEKIINIPQRVELLMVKDPHDNSFLLVKGPLGKTNLSIPKELYILIKESSLRLGLKSYIFKEKQLLETFFTLINQKIKGVIQGYKKELKLVGVGYRAIIKKKSLVLSLGYSHKINITFDEDLKVFCPNQKSIFIKGVDLFKVNQKAAEIRLWRLPEPYKGKGIFYKGETIKKKEGKKN